MRDLRDHLSGLLAQEYPYYGLNPEDHNAAADAVLRVVGERLIADDVVIAANNAYCDADSPFDALDDFRAALSAAWRVVTGSNHE